jgi:hypothetical protein
MSPAMNQSSPLRNFGAFAIALALTAFATASTAVAQQKFTSPDEAVETLAAALRAKDDKAVAAIFGPGSAALISSGDSVNDENVRKAFVLAYDLKHAIKTDGGKATLLVGDDYPFSIPLTQKDGVWSFDVAAGREELLARRIGRNELAAIQVCLAYVDAQNEFADMTKIGGLSVYAQRLISTPGTKNGLYWPTTAGEPPSPMGAAVAIASARGYRVGRGEPYHGYHYKILTKQGPKAPDGEHDYVVNGKMIGGFALVAWPANYGNSGIATFMINHAGDVFEKDLGEATDKVAPHIATFNPDDSWKKVTIEK